MSVAVGTCLPELKTPVAEWSTAADDVQGPFPCVRELLVDWFGLSQGFMQVNLVGLGSHEVWAYRKLWDR